MFEFMSAVDFSGTSVEVLFRRQLPSGVGDLIGRLAKPSTSTTDHSAPAGDSTDPENYRLTVSGLCSRTHQFSLSALRDIFDVRQLYGHSNSIGLQTWTGCLLGDILDFVGNSGQATDILLVGAGGHLSNDPNEHSAVLIPVDSASNDNVLIAWSVEGNSLGNARRGSDALFGPVDAIIATDGHTHRVTGLSRITLASISS
jgi:DMSO/TMAO reductase YedYZ molybdopterin-dependent catalytic subunit